MANELQNSIFEAVGTIIEKRVEELELDKTIVASIEQLVDAEAKQYRVQYKGGSIYAYAQTDAVYSPHTSVYVSIPQNDFSKKKWIVGKVSETTGDNAITEVSTALEDYQLVGNNTVSLIDENNKEFGLYSYKPNGDALTLYSRANPENNVLQVDEENLKLYLQNSIALLIEATFRTDLDSIQKKQTDGEYGLIFDLIFEDGDATYATRLDQFSALAPTIALAQEDGGSLSLVACDAQINQLVHSEENNTDNIAITFEIQKAAVLAMQGQFSSEENELVSLYLSLLEEMETLFKNGEDWRASYDSWFAQNINTLVTKRLIYQLDSNNMVGNPLLFKTSTEQYDIYPIDTGRFQYIEDITFYCKGFKGSSDWEAQGADIFVKDIEFYGLEQLTSTNGDYSLRVAFPQGQVFDDVSVGEDGEIVYPPNLKIKGTMAYKNADLTTGVSWYWFIKDGLVSSAEHADYHYLGGVGWRWFDNVTNRNLTVSAKNNTAYENIYKCIAVYNSTMILKTEFTVYNNANRRTITIESDLGERFKFDRGVPKLTCKILEPFMDEEEPVSIPDSFGDYVYSYQWLRRDAQGQTVVFDCDYETFQKEYANSEFSQQMVMKSKLNELKDVEIDKNTLTYPASKIASDSTMIFECYVYRSKGSEEKVYIGCGQIILKNESAATINDYYIVIENGDQVFQYTESGVSPCNERMFDPQEVKTLVCHLYDPNGLEVNSAHYSHRWLYPIGNSLIVPPEDLEVNPSNDIAQVYRGDMAGFEIKESYDYSALNNQITCEVQYDSIKISKDTEFYFGKIGDNGTNGTDVVASIQPWVTGSKLDNEPLTLIKTTHGSYWNSGLAFNEATTPLELKLYRRNSYIDPAEYKNPKWTMAGGATKSKVFAASASETNPHLGILTTNNNTAGKYTNCIVKAEAKLAKVDGSGETQTHYAFYPVPVIEYTSNAAIFDIAIDKKHTLKQIIYNADGRNPMYNENQGVFFNFSEDENSDYTVSWTAKGGLTAEEDEPSFDLYYSDPTKLSSHFEDCKFIYIKPKDVYSGAAQNNYVLAEISKISYIDGEQTLTLVASVIIPLYMSLNLFGLASLNSWDGNTIEINEDENYIMAPQIGAGVKNQDNTFTGIVMGKATTYDMEEEQVGLLGYSDGRQSIFLDAETGSATFGLAEADDRYQDSDSSYTEGRIELVPGGTSRIAQWKIGSRNLYNISSEKNNDSDGLLRKNNKIVGYDDNYAQEHKMDIDHSREGIMLSAEPAYISIKGRPLTEDEVSKETDKNVNIGDSLELQLDPAQASLFSVFAHKKTISDEGEESWQRVLLSGINDKGQLIANTLQNGSDSGAQTTFGIGNVGAFGDDANSPSYLGATFGATATNNILKTTAFFRIFGKKGEEEDEGILDTGGPIYINGGRFGSNGNEYSRPLNFYGASLSLYADKNSNFNTSRHQAVLSPDAATFGHISEVDGTYLQLNDKENSLLKINKDFSVGVDKGNLNVNIASGSASLFAADSVFERTEGSILLSRVSSDASDLRGVQITKDNILFGDIDAFKATDINESWTLASEQLTSSISSGMQLKSTSKSTFLASNPQIGIYSQNSIEIRSLIKSGSNTGSPILIATQGTNGTSSLTLSPQSSGDKDTARISSEHGSIGIRQNCRGSLTTSDTNGIVINPGFSSGFGIFTSNIGAGDMVGASLYCAKDIYLGNFTWAGDWNDTRLNNMGTNKDGYLTYILVKMYQDYVSRATSAGSGKVSSSTYNSHTHSFSKSVTFTEANSTLKSGVTIKYYDDTGTLTSVYYPPSLIQGMTYTIQGTVSGTSSTPSPKA